MKSDLCCQHSHKSKLKPKPKPNKPKLSDRSDELIISVAPNLFNYRSDIVLIEHRSHAIAARHVFQSFAYFTNVQSTPREQRM